MESENNQQMEGGKCIPYSVKFWQALNLAKWSKMAVLHDVIYTLAGQLAECLCQ